MTDGLKVLVVVQRYGEEVIGGAESHARLVAERLAARAEVEVATTTALDYWTWAPHYAPGITRFNDVAVRRFPVRDGRAADFKRIEQHVLFERHTLDDEQRFIRAQGPWAPELLEFLHAEGDRYHAVLFYGYLYAPSVLGLPIVPERAILVSTAHDELPLRLAPYRALFHLPRAIGFLTPEERDLVHRVFKNEDVPDEVLGIALEEPPDHDPAALRARHRFAGPLVAYLGQVTPAKGCDELFRHWSAWRDRPGAPDATLVLAGEVRMPIPERRDLVALGRVSEEEKFALLSTADALVLPSHLESLGIVLLEAWQVGTPVLVPAWNAVTAGQVARTGAGLTYRDAASFGEAIESLLRERRSRGAAGREHVARECTPEAFDARLDRLLALGAIPA
jgi:glycosyltransferase involved in cell wall biosynthesis